MDETLKLVEKTGQTMERSRIMTILVAELEKNPSKEIVYFIGELNKKINE